MADLRVVLKEGEPWFVAKDVCDALGTETRDVRKILDSDEVASIHIGNRGGRPSTIINESGLYSLILRSRKPEAKRFKKWVTAEVLPSIRKHGGYLTAEKTEEALLNPDVLIRLATDLKNERALRLEAERTKAHISSSREASVMGKLSGASKKIARLEDENGELKECVGDGSSRL